MEFKEEKAVFGIAGLDEVTAGGLTRGRLFLLEGSPGTGKTTIATQFLMAGVEAGERSLYITLSETEDELRAGAASHGWSLDGIDLFELVPPESLLDDEQQQSLLYSADLELGETTKRIFEAFGPRRFFWGTDITKMPCTWRQCVTLFTEELPWIAREDLRWVMGDALCEWLGWQPGIRVQDPN